MNITLIGMSGVGKSIIGKVLSKRLNNYFIDVDELIEKNNRLKLQQIIEKFGNDRFLEIEEKTILELKANNCVITPGGSVVYSKKAIKFLKKKSIVIFLNDSLKNIKKRINDFSSRGIVGLERGLEKLFNERLPLYNRYADISIDVSDFNAESIAKSIIDKIKERGFN
jgi:shikimate kinase